MSRSPSFSIVIAAYQAADTIGRAVESALDQTHPAHEVVVCDDGSTDDLEGALRPYRDRILLLRKPNGGAPTAHNLALTRITGDFYALLDADDAYRPERLAAFAEVLAERPHIDLIASDAEFEVDGRITGRILPDMPDPADLRGRLLKGSWVFAPAVRRTRLLAVGGWDESLRIAYDWDLWLRVVLSGGEPALVPRPLALYSLRPDSLSADRAPSLLERVTVLEKLARRSDLSAEEQAIVLAGLGIASGRARVADARAALRPGARDARRRLVLAARCTDVPRRSRVKFAAAAAAPPIARALMGHAAGDERVKSLSGS